MCDSIDKTADCVEKHFSGCVFKFKNISSLENIVKIKHFPNFKRLCTNPVYHMSVYETH